MVLLSAQAMDVPAIAKVTFTTHDRVRDQDLEAVQRPRRQWTARGGAELMPRRRRRATYTRPHGVRLGIVLDNFSPHLSARTDRRVTDWAASNNVELAHVPTNASWLPGETNTATINDYANRRQGEGCPMRH
jgi:hypothetical protein